MKRVVMERLVEEAHHNWMNSLEILPTNSKSEVFALSPKMRLL